MKSSVDPGKYGGPCPVDLVFTTIVDTDSPGEVTYEWVRNRKEDGEVLSSTSDGTRHTLEMTWTIETTPPKGLDLRVATKVLTPSAATASPARAYVLCTETSPKADGATPSGGSGESGAASSGDDAAIEFGTMETDVIGEEAAGPTGSADSPTSATEATISCPERTGISILDDVPNPWWSTASYATLTRANVLAADRLLACDYGSGDRRVRLSRKFPEGAASCVVRNNREFDCTN